MSSTKIIQPIASRSLITSTKPKSTAKCPTDHTIAVKESVSTRASRDSVNAKTNKAATHIKTSKETINAKSFKDSPYMSKPAKPKKELKKKKILRSQEKIYSASGQAPAPSKDFFEICIYSDIVYWRKWRIKYSKNGKVIPSEDKFSPEQYLDSDITQRDVERFLGDDVLHMTIGHLSKQWFPRVPTSILSLITSYLEVKDICHLQQVCSVLSKRLRKDVIWEYHLLKDFGMTFGVEKSDKGRFKKLYVEQVIYKKEHEIDWDNV